MAVAAQPGPLSPGATAQGRTRSRGLQGSPKGGHPSLGPRPSCVWPRAFLHVGLGSQESGHPQKPLSACLVSAAPGGQLSSVSVSVLGEVCVVQRHGVWDPCAQRRDGLRVL